MLRLFRHCLEAYSLDPLLGSSTDTHIRTKRMSLTGHHYERSLSDSDSLLMEEDLGYRIVLLRRNQDTGGGPKP